MYKKFISPILHIIAIAFTLLAFYEINNVREISSEQTNAIDNIQSCVESTNLSCEKTKNQGHKLNYELNKSLNRMIVYFMFDLILFIQIGRLSKQKYNQSMKNDAA